MTTALTASKPEVTILQNDEQPISGANLTLRCRVRGYPVPVITWFKDQMKVRPNDHISTTPDGELSIKVVGREDSGVYTCEALNDLGMDRKQVGIKVQEPVTDASVTGNNFKIM